MRKMRRGSAQRVIDVDLPRRVVDVIVATNDVSDVHVDVVDDDAEVVRRDAVGAHQHEIIELRVGNGDRALDEIVERDHAIVRIAEAHDRRHALGLAEPEPLCVLGSPAAVVARLLAARASAARADLELFLRRVIVVSVALSDQLLGDLTITGRAASSGSTALS